MNFDCIKLDYFYCINISNYKIIIWQLCWKIQQLGTLLTNRCRYVSVGFLQKNWHTAYVLQADSNPLYVLWSIYMHIPTYHLALHDFRPLISTPHKLQFIFETFKFEEICLANMFLSKQNRKNVLVNLNVMIWNSGLKKIAESHILCIFWFCNQCKHQQNKCREKNMKQKHHTIE